jgi:hypothetical protein
MPPGFWLAVIDTGPAGYTCGHLPVLLLRCFHPGNKIDNQRRQIPVGHSTVSGTADSTDRMRE